GVPRADGLRCRRAPDWRGPGRRVHEPRGPGARRAAGDRDGRRCGGARLSLQAARTLRPDHHRRWHEHGRRRMQGARRRRRRGHDRLGVRPRRRGAGPGLPLGHGDAAREPAARDADSGRRGRLPRADPFRARELSVYSEIFSCTHPIESILASGYKGIILSGGPSSVYEDGAPLPPKTLFDSGIPILGICYGMQAMGYLLGGHVVPAERREYGAAQLKLEGAGGLLDGVEPEHDDRISVWMSHGDTVMKPPRGFVSLASTENCPVAAMA